MAEYIERESIKKSINSLLDMVLKFTHSPIEIKQLVFDAIDEERATDVQPVKRGRWIIEDDVEHFIAVCSECGRTEDSRDIKDMPYCHCGARMDGDKANNVRNLTDEETEIYESWIDHEAKDTGVNIMDGDT